MTSPAITSAGSLTVSEVERFAQRKFVYASHLAALIDESSRRHMEAAFEDTLFFAKFLVNAYALLARAGTGSAETEKLATEFKENFEKVSTLLKTVMKEAPPEIKDVFIHTFFDSSRESVDRIMGLLRELTWVKNYRIDGGSPRSIA